MAVPDYRTAFEFAPIGLVLSRQRTMVDCNRALLDMFRAGREQLIGQSFRVLYPTQGEYERTGLRIVASLGDDGRYADERVMRRVDGELFWCHVSGRALEAGDPHALGIWSFEDLSAHRAMRQEFTGREREIAALLIEGLTSKLIGKRLAGDSVAQLQAQQDVPAKKRAPRKESTNNDDLSDSDDDLSGDEFGDDGQKRERR